MNETELTPEEAEGSTIDPFEDLDQGLKEIRKARPAYERAERYFLGTEEEKFISTELRKLLTGSATDFNVNLAGRVVSAVTDRLEIAAITAAPAGTTNRTASMDAVRQVNNGPRHVSDGPAPIDETVTDLTWVLNEKVWHANELDIEAPEVHEKATYFGDAYLFVWPSGEDDDSVDDEGYNKIDVFFNSPLGCRMLYDSENPRKPRVYVKTWVMNNGYKRVNLFYPDYIVKFISKTKKSRGDKALDYRPLTPYEDPDVDEHGVAENPFGEIPAFHFRTARPYGRPEHEGAYGPQDAITKLVKLQMTVSDFAAYPQRYALGETGVGTDDDLDWMDSQEESNPEDLASNFVSGAGRVWVLRGTRAVGQFASADIQQVIQPLDKFIELMASTTGTPLTYLHKVRGTSSTPLSGESQKQTEVMLVKKIAARQRSYAASWRKAMQFAMKLLGFEDALVTIQWAATMQSNDLQTWEGVLAQQRSGIPVRQTLLEQGYPETQVNSWGYTEEDPNGFETPEVTNPHNPFYGKSIEQMRPLEGPPTQTPFSNSPDEKEKSSPELREELRKEKESLKETAGDNSRQNR